MADPKPQPKAVATDVEFHPANGGVQLLADVFDKIGFPVTHPQAIADTVTVAALAAVHIGIDRGAFLTMAGMAYDTTHDALEEAGMETPTVSDEEKAAAAAELRRSMN